MRRRLIPAEAQRGDKGLTAETPEDTQRLS